MWLLESDCLGSTPEPYPLAVLCVFGQVSSAFPVSSLNGIMIVPTLRAVLSVIQLHSEASHEHLSFWQKARACVPPAWKACHC